MQKGYSVWECICNSGIEKQSPVIIVEGLVAIVGIWSYHTLSCNDHNVFVLLVAMLQSIFPGYCCLWMRPMHS